MVSGPAAGWTIDLQCYRRRTRKMPPWRWVESCWGSPPDATAGFTLITGGTIIGGGSRAHGISEFWASRIISQARSTQRCRPIIRAAKDRLTGRLVELACCCERYGYRRMTALLQREGWRVNHRRVGSLDTVESQ